MSNKPKAQYRIRTLRYITVLGIRTTHLIEAKTGRAWLPVGSARFGLTMVDDKKRAARLIHSLKLTDGCQAE